MWRCHIGILYEREYEYIEVKKKIKNEKEIKKRNKDENKDLRICLSLYSLFTIINIYES